MDRNKLGRAATSWQQPALFPLESIRCDFVVYLDGAVGRMQIGWTIAEWPADQTIELEVLRAEPVAGAPQRALEVIETVLRRAVGLTGPF